MELKYEMNKFLDNEGKEYEGDLPKDLKIMGIQGMFQLCVCFYSENNKDRFWYVIPFKMREEIIINNKIYWVRNIKTETLNNKFYIIYKLKEKV